MNTKVNQVDLTSRQSDYAIFLPALSGFYATFIGKQREPNVPSYIDPARFPQGVTDMEQLNWLNPQQALFPYRWSLYSAGHANLDLAQQDWGEDMVRNRDPESVIVGDSGGFQIAKGQWPGNWRAPNSQLVADQLTDAQTRKTEKRTVKVKNAKTGQLEDREVEVDLVKEHHRLLAEAQKKREGVLRWLDGVANYGMILDIPAWVSSTPEAKVCGIHTYQEAVDATQYNNEYFINNRRGKKSGGARFLNVMQGSNHTQADDWYEKMKKYCDPQQYPENHFDGWAFGGQTKTDVELMLKRLIAIKFDGLMQQDQQDWLHVLGTSKLEYALLLTNIQRAIRKYVNPKFTISFDCASPYLATANGQIYYQTRVGRDLTKKPNQHHDDLFESSGTPSYPNYKTWSYRMIKSIDDKKYATDTRTFKDVCLQDFPGRFNVFEDSPISSLCKIKDICFYKPGVRKTDRELADEFGEGVEFNAQEMTHYHVLPDLNKIGKVGNTSWDSFSYALQMCHNTYLHIHAVQEANRQYDAGSYPQMMEYQAPSKDKCRDIIDAIFAADTKEQAIEIIEHYHNYWMEIIGNHGFIGKKAKNSSTMFNAIFSFDDADDDDDVEVDEQVISEDLSETKLTQLEENRE